MIVLDTSGLLAAIDASQRDHAACRAVLDRAQGPLLLSPFVLAELDYLLMTRVGLDAELALLEEVARGAYRLEPFGTEDVAIALALVREHAEHRIGLADASVVVVANRHRAGQVLTLDERHFRCFRRPSGRPFQILPADG